MIELNGVFFRVDRRLREPRVLDFLLEKEASGRAFLGEAEKVDELAKKLQSFGYTTDVSLDEEHSVQKIVFRQGSETPRTIGYQLLSSAEYQRLLALHKSVGDMDRPPFVVKADSSKHDSVATLNSRQELIDHVMELGKKDVQIQRYKGLGEMNPDQLWETTMDPEKRTLLQVQVNDKVFTDDIFTILMGDAVEPRRQFIEANALDVKNLDIQTAKRMADETTPPVPPTPPEPPVPPSPHVPVNLEDEMRKSYVDYAMSVIIGRALPDVRDGLKPVHRRILFGMHEMGLASNRAYRK
jgi:DNA gyrase subunit B